jgi:hypothetical protein
MPTTATKPRVPSSGPDAGQAASSLDYGGQDRAEAMLIYRGQLWIYLRSHGLGHEFQAIDFSTWLKERDLQPDPAKIDPRATGGLFLDLVRHGICEKIGYKSNGGDKSRNYHSTARQTYRIVHLDHSLLGWTETHPAFYPRGGNPFPGDPEFEPPPWKPGAPYRPEPDDAPTPVDAADPEFDAADDPHQARFEFD